MNSEGGGIRSERGAIRVRDGDGSWAGPLSPFVVVRAGVASSLLAVLVVRRSSPVVVRSLSFILFHRSFVLRRWHLALLIWGGMQWTVLALHCHWAVDGGRVALAWRAAMEEGGGTYSFIEYDDDDTIVVVVVILWAVVVVLGWLGSFACGRLDGRWMWVGSG